MFRVATLDDFAAIDELIVKKAKEFQVAGKSQWVKYLEPSRSDYVRHDLTKGTVFVYERDHQVVGAVSLIPPTDWDHNLWDHPNDAVYLHRLVTDSSAKGERIGERLMQFALSHTTSTVRLDCVADNAFLNGYYLQFGFRYIRERDGFSLFEKQA
ncbi:GNAT family N-acetyltransferase [Exiguobacterium qingdaonense]|uniref:GNAT family N-acetyltransferase n=1 Tax=Exiguobacterium qingdaonense TaxID=2751251 RepID=UPI001BE9E16D|nr:GNAT family N-acetyltransferase [Exiguobacterium qingdaonense]